MTTVAVGAVGFVECTVPDVPDGDAWLSARERDVLAGFRFDARRRDWRLGRWTAKLAMAQGMAAAGYAPADPLDVEILAAADGAPEGFVGGAPAPCSISLSHRGGRALAAVAPAGTPIGCDLEVIEPRAPVFVTDYFTDRERALLVGVVPADRADLIVTMIWSAKEATLKAMRCGLRADTRWVEVDPFGPGVPKGGWQPFSVCSARDGLVFHGWWRHEVGLVRTVVTVGASPPPIALPAA